MVRDHLWSNISGQLGRAVPTKLQHQISAQTWLELTAPDWDDVRNNIRAEVVSVSGYGRHVMFYDDRSRFAS